VLLAAATFALLLATASAIPIIWDEGEYLWRSGLVRAWFQLLTHPHSSNGGSAALSDSVIATHWKSMIWEEGHPGAGTIAIALGSGLFGGILHPLTAARSGTIAVFALACLLFFSSLRAPLLEPQEARYAEIPREMLASGDLVVPRLNGLPYFEKPPLLYWANAASLRLFGETPFAARLPTRLAGTGRLESTRNPFTLSCSTR
jgi:hypothetical protein